MHKVFETERLLIRPTSEDDSELIYQLMNTPKFIKYVGDRAIDSVEAGANYIRTKMLPQLHTLGYSNYTIIIKSEGQKIGTCGLYKREGV
ncbi:MAG: GNAT family N-acetyltransferase, partial [Gelidibacter sp.]